MQTQGRGMVSIMGSSLSLRLIYIFCAFCAIIRILIGQALVSAVVFFQIAGSLHQRSTTKETTSTLLHRTSVQSFLWLGMGISTDRHTCRKPFGRAALFLGIASHTWTSFQLQSYRSCSDRNDDRDGRDRDGHDNRGNRCSQDSSDTRPSILNLLPSNLL